MHGSIIERETPNGISLRQPGMARESAKMGGPSASESIGLSNVVATALRPEERRSKMGEIVGPQDSLRLTARGLRQSNISRFATVFRSY